MELLESLRSFIKHDLPAREHEKLDNIWVGRIKQAYNTLMATEGCDFIYKAYALGVFEGCIAQTYIFTDLITTDEHDHIYDVVYYYKFELRHNLEQTLDK